MAPQVPSRKFFHTGVKNDEHTIPLLCLPEE